MNTGISVVDAQSRVEALLQSMQGRFDRHVMDSPFVHKLEAGSLPIEAVRRYYHGLVQFVLVSNRLNLEVYYRQFPILIHHWDLLEFFAGKIADEFMYPKPPGHLLMLLGMGRTLGLTDEQMISQPATARARGMSDYLRTVVEHGAPIDYWAASLSEGAFGTFAQLVGKALVTHYRLTKEQILYWTAHHEQDLLEHDGRLGHGTFNKTVLERYLVLGYDNDPTSFGLDYLPVTMVDLWRQLLDDAMEPAGEA